MDTELTACIQNLGSINDKVRMCALQTILAWTDEPVGWIYEVWDSLVAKLNHENSYQRSIAIIVLCNLAKSDRENRMAGILDELLAHTRDEKFITSRQCIQNIWKAAVTGDEAREKVFARLEKRFAECADEPHANLLRQDCIQAFQAVYDTHKDEAVLKRARALALKECDEKNRKKLDAILTQGSMIDCIV
jgi:hypothetical protein